MPDTPTDPDGCDVAAVPALPAPPTIDELLLLGHGPEATGSGPGGGWWMRRELWFGCGGCGGLVSGDPAVSEACRCGALSKDGDAGRIGSRHGDPAIAVYRRRQG